MRSEFANERLTDFADERNHLEYEAALKRVEASLGKSYALVIGSERLMTEQRLTSVNPARLDQTIGEAAQADAGHAEKAMQTAAQAYRSWSRVEPHARARCLFKAAAAMRRRKHEFSAWITLEAGKTRAEADAETAEAIDFMEFYGREMLRLSEPQPLTRLADEDNELVYIPLGPGVVIPPWNFPLAITAGMTTAALVAGNTVVLKPSSQTPVIAALLVELLLEAGIPEGAINYLPGPGGGIGDYLVDHRLTRFVCFTGSRDVGLRIYERASRTAPGQIWMKRVIAEMGGKDAIVVDRDADVELVSRAIVASAFGYSGQKCSACSRAIVHKDVYEAVLARVVERTKRLVIGSPSERATDVGPVIDEKSYLHLMKAIANGKQEGRLVMGGGTSESSGAGGTRGYYVEPTIFAKVGPTARLAQEELFGPVVAFTKASSFEKAIAMANGTEYGLTGSVFSRDRANLELARREFHVGNLYLNRKCTGALVGAHPFGGFNMSGTDSKAGGRDYLLLFTQAKLVSELL
ncbi:MAG: L-glutamate gamma-semialdehyde dehydrogenase [Paenibacillus sp.]|jgi:1-pyrroline-5-carboxylate dehydrogenase|nr:L-glutamate gamma-semialdehyde dehydrogenase [Paenibacillus sp.]